MDRQGGGSDDIISIASEGGEIVVLPQHRPVVGAALRVPAHTERRLRAAEVALRLAVCGFALLAAVLLGVARETHDFFGLFVKVARYTDMPSLVILVITNGVAASYSLLQGGRCVVSTVRGRAIASRPLACAVFLCDQARQRLFVSLIVYMQVMAYVALSALAGALVAAMIGKFGLAEFGWMKTADFYKKFSMQVTGAILAALVAVVAMVAVSALSAFNLFRL
ncbi:hypothetical protein HU200_023573 [Digitaria exilis]|uniref:CASP-like protein n=1 Tax=Digitaria exilis TaxID=1010633 RepID=A0A835EWP0_9POAL|nr:hypothetical protein HU200_023573 [Digitaria exilis]